MKKEVRNALQRAKELARKPVPTREEIVAVYKDGLEEAEKLRKLLKPEWFMNDVCKPTKKTKKKTTKKKISKKPKKTVKKTTKKTKKKAKKKSRSTRKKKSL